MLEKVADFLLGKTKSLVTGVDGKPTERDVQIATGVLLLEVAGADSDFAPEETKVVFESMMKQFRVNDEEVLSLLETADSLRRDKNKIDQFYDLINQHFDAGQRTVIFATLWKVILADGRVDKAEMRSATQIRFRLQLSDEDFEKAKSLAESGKV